MNTANTPSDNPVEQARSRLLGTLAGTSDRTRELLRTRAGVRYAYEVPDTDQPPTNMVYLDIDGAQFGRAILAVHAGEEMRLVDLGTRNALSKTVPGAGSLLMLAVLAFWLSWDLRRIGWRSSYAARDFYTDKLFWLIYPLHEEMGLRWSSEWGDFTIERLRMPPTKKDPEGSLVESD